jgi:D-alanyl-lipoteichoic acid acyltransferase DltB (MBOAT superfamily)
LSFLSLQFILLSLAAAALMWSTRGAVRLLGFLLASGYFAYTFLGVRGMAWTLSYCVAGYVCAVVVRRYPRWLWLAVTALALVFIYARGYSFLRFVLPEGLQTRILATAGLSFLFFKILHVVIDTAGGAIKLSFWRYLTYCFNFTTFLLGPIQRYQHFESQWNGTTDAIPATFEAHLDAVNRILRGMVKKYVVAEFLSVYALQGNAPVATMSLVDLQLATYLFYVFLYFDFSGYCDIVIGVGCLLGVRPPENFNLPFLAPNPTQYWLRVHESLTRWLTDYIFNPLYAAALRSRSLGPHPLAAMMLAVMVTMLIAGLWHGTTVNFILFGLLHGLYLVVFRTYEHAAIGILGRKGLQRLRSSRTWLVASTVITFHFTATAYVFFVLDIDQLRLILERL